MLAAFFFLFIINLSPQRPLGVERQASTTRSAAPELLPERWFAPRAVHHARFDSADDARLAALRARGAVRWGVDYESFLEVGIDDRAARGDTALRASDL